jgi:hypothetical protein
MLRMSLDIWYNKWAGGDREDSYSKYSIHSTLWNEPLINIQPLTAKLNPKLAVISNAMQASPGPILPVSDIAVFFLHVDVVHTAGSVSTYTPSRIQIDPCPTAPRTALLGTSLPITEMTWVVWVVLTDRIGRYMSGGSRKRGMGKRPRK